MVNDNIIGWLAIAASVGAFAGWLVVTLLLRYGFIN